MKKLTLLFLTLVIAGMQLLLAQGVQVTGKVTSTADGTAVPGASILVKGTTIGTISDFDGSYKLTVPATATTLVISFVGLKTVEIPISGRTSIDVAMEADVLKVDEVVVTAIGIKKEAKALGYAVSDVKSDAISKSNNTNVLNSINGKIPGVQITSSTGAAGASTFVEIRGSTSITGNNQPLFVIDGVPINTSPTSSGAVDGVAYSDRAIDINPDDIESMSVLKGGAATALYGLRAANGAVIITTKKGQANKKMQVNFRSAVTIDKISQTQALQNKFSQGTGGVYRDALSASSGRYRSWGARLDTMSYTTNPAYPVPGGISMADYIKYWNPNGVIVPKSNSNANGKPVQTYDEYAYFQTGVSYDNSLSISAGNALSSYYLSVGNVTNGSIIPSNAFSRTSFKLSGDTKLSEKLKVEASVTYSNSKGDRVQQGSNISGVMLGLLRTPPNFDNAYGYQLPSGDQRDFRGINGGFDNPYWVSNNTKYKDQVDRMIGYTGFKYAPLDWLQINYKAGVDWFLRGYKNYFAFHSNQFPDGRNDVGHSLSRDINSDFMVNINRNLTSDLNFNLLLGQNMYQSYYESTSAVANGLLIPGWFNMGNTSDNRGYEGTSEKRTAAIYGNLDIGWKSMLFLSATLRNEWSTTMPENANSFMYPSVGGSFIFTELPFLKGNPVLSFGKLRGSWATVANDASAYGTKTYWGVSGASDGWVSPSGITFPFMNTNGLTLSNNIGNDKLKPETTTTWELGTDLRFFNNRFNIDFAYFRKDSKDLLIYVPIAATTGYGNAYMNAGEIKTTGVEISANVDVIRTKDLTWSLGVNFSNPYSEVTKLAEGVPNVFLGGFEEPQVRAVVGKAYRSVYGWAMQKAPNGQPIVSDDPANYQGYPLPGISGEQEYIGQVAPKWISNITTGLRYKGISFSALLQIKKGGLMWNGTKGALYSYGVAKDTETRQAKDLGVYSGLLGHGDANSNLVHFAADGVTEVAGPGAANKQKVVLHDEAWTRAGYGNGFNGPSEPYIEKSDWTRLREVTLSYTLATAAMQQKLLKSLEVYFTGRNLFLSTPYTGIDPETSLTGADNAQGFDYFNMPGTKGYTFGVKFTF